MARCDACAMEILGDERFCRNCGARIAVLVEDLADTNEFSPPISQLKVAPVGQGSVVDPFYATASTTFPLAEASGALKRTVSWIRLRFSGKLLWIGLFLLTLIFAISGLAIGRDYIRSRRLVRLETIREVEMARQRRQAKQAEILRHSMEASIQNALGFKPAAISTVEFPDIQGVFVASLVSQYSPAALAHFRAGDVLTEFAGRPISNSIDLAQLLETLKPGSEVGTKVYRDGKTIALNIAIDDRSSPPTLPKTPPRDQGFLGLGNVTRHCCVPGTKQWALEVHRIVDNSPADLAGLQLGDLITEFNEQSIATPDELGRHIQSSTPRTRVKLKFYRGSAEHTVELTVGHGW